MAKISHKWPLLILLAGGLAGGALWWFQLDEAVPVVESMEPLQWPRGGVEPVREPSFATLEEAEKVFVAVDEIVVEWPEGTVNGELVLSFRSQAELERFMREARRRGLQFDVEALLGIIRLRQLTPAQAREVREIAGDALLSYNPYVLSPDVPPLDDGSFRHYRPFGDRALDWLGVPQDNADWGRGVKVAVLDTGLAEHPALAHLKATQMSLISEQDQQAGVGFHGTAVTSIIAGDGEGIRGIAPGVDVLSIQVLDAGGVGTGYELARGILAAVDAGASVINLSLGTTVHSQFLYDAVNYAMEQNVVVIASAGNGGDGQLLFPARYPGVVAVGAVDATNQHVAFSNRGHELNIAAPGFGVTAAGADGSSFSFTGTSGSTPFVTGAVAALLSLEPHLSPAQAASVILAHTNDAGPPGPDGYFGEGIMDMGRVLRRAEPGIIDVAIGDHHLDMRSGAPVLYVSVQNRGTEAVGNVFLEVNLNGRSETALLGRLGVGEVTHRELPLGAVLETGAAAAVSSRVSIPGVADAFEGNNSLNSRVQAQP
jgi:hypothetical protein